jgi:hypothetical protein
MRSKVFGSYWALGFLALACTEPQMKLGEEPLTGAAKPCVYRGLTYQPGQSFQCECNSCRCVDGDKVESTLLFCGHPDSGAGGLAPGEDLVVIEPGTLDAMAQSSCAGVGREREAPRINLELVVDLSQPMSRSGFGATATDWDFMREALRGFVASPFWAYAAGISFFPNQATTSHAGDPLPSTACVNTGDDVPLAPLWPPSTQPTAIDDALARVAPNPSAGAPIRDAYRLALAAFASDQSASVGRYVALVTQGFSTFDLGCLGSNSAPVGTQSIVDDIRAARASGIGTFVVGAPGSDLNPYGGGDARSWLSEAARAGGTSRRNCSDQGPDYCHIDMTQSTDLAAAMRDSMLDISPLPCALSVPAGPDNTALDPNAVAVVFESFDGIWYLVRRNDAAVCDRGWHYIDGGASIEACGDTCWALGRAATVELYFGCANGAAQDAGTPTSCYSPTQNLDHAYDAGAVGCACADTGPGVCLDDGTGRLVALICQLGRWVAVEDGACGA